MHSTALNFGPHFPELVLRRWDKSDADLDTEDGSVDWILQLSIPNEDAIHRWPFHYGDDELAAFARGIITELSQKNFTTQWMQQRPEKHADLLRGIMLQSHKFLKGGLGTDNLSDFAAKLSEIEEGGVLMVGTRNRLAANFVWGLLHPWPVPSTEKLSSDGFLATRFVLVDVSSSLPSAVRAAGSVHDVFAGPPLREYGFVDDSDLPSVIEQIERNVLIELVGESFDPLHNLAAEDESLSKKEELIEYLLKSRTLVHFACHSSAGDEEGGPAAHYQIRVRNQQMVETSWLKRQLGAQPDIGELIGPSYKLMFLNICHSMRKTGRDDKSAGHALERLQPHAAIGIRGMICDKLAANFATRFYREALANGRTVGEAFRTSLREGLATSSNPAHLLFVLKGQPGVSIA